jgi:hypothetical protein
MSVWLGFNIPYKYLCVHGKKVHTKKSSLPRWNGQSDIDSFTRIKHT